MRRNALACIVAALAASISLSAAAQKITVGFVGDEGSFGAHNKGALKYAKANYAVTVIHPNDLAKAALTNHAVVWWHDGDTDPNPLLSDAGKKALKSYVDSGGAVLLSAAAEMLASPLGVETGVPRIYGPGNDGQAAAVVIRDDTLNHPIWKGFNRKVGEKIQVTSLGYPKSSDYWSRKFVDAVTIGNCWETGKDWADEVGAFVEWTSKAGKVFGMGWRLPHFTDDNKDLATLGKVTTNVIEYLASGSAYLSVDPSGKAATKWGKLKTSR